MVIITNISRPTVITPQFVFQLFHKLQSTVSLCTEVVVASALFNEGESKKDVYGYHD